ncbi:MAG TPA: sulfurtransferase TusA family protein [Firmicutes bacterium]|nr:sulfurtransferase TusA family protein [Bacillota bacterium]
MAQEPKKRLDLHGVICPMNFVKTKLALEDLTPGDLLEIIIDEGDAMLNVPRSIKEEGHKIIKVIPLGETFQILIEKGQS